MSASMKSLTRKHGPAMFHPRGRSRAICAAATLLGLFGPLVLAVPRPASADVVTDWNATLTAAIRTAGLPPPVQMRPAAIVSVAVFDAVNGIARKYEPYLVKEWAPGGARQEAAAAQAAYTTLINLFPAQKPTFDAQLVASLNQISGSSGNSQSIARGRAWGERVALTILERRRHDGYSATVPPYFGGTGPGVWRSVPDGSLPAGFQQVAFMTPFAMAHPAQFRPEPPPHLTSPEYAADLNEVKVLGGTSSSTRTPEQTQIARLWQATAPTADENDIARDYVAPGTELVDTARLFALFNMALADAVIYVFDAKRAYNLWRPHHAVCLADSDGNPATDADPSWTALIQPTPNYQEYPSAHAAISGAGLRVLMHLLGDEHTVLLRSPGYPGFTWTYPSFSAAAAGVQEARIWGGLHFRFACQVGGRDGLAIADYVVANYLRPHHNRGR